MSTNDQEWKKLTFAQRMGVEQLPTPLEPTELTDGLRAALWGIVFDHISQSVSSGFVRDPWRSMLYRKHVQFENEMADEFTAWFETIKGNLSYEFKNGGFAFVYGMIEYFLRDPSCPKDLHRQVDDALKKHLAPYIVVDKDTLMPVASAEQGQLLAHALEQLQKTPMAGASQHLRQSIELLNKGHWAKSVAESIHAVESVARKIEPTANTLDPALKKLAPKINMHPALRDAFGKLYGYTSDQQGIRHALIDPPTAAVDRDDAIFMLTACAAFSSYLVNKATVAGLL